MQKGKITQIIGPVVDIRFKGELPKIYDALEVHLETKSPSESRKITLETQQHLGLREVRAVAMSSTDGLMRGQEVSQTGSPISVPVGKEILGRMFDVSGRPIDGMP